MANPNETPQALITFSDFATRSSFRTIRVCQRMADRRPPTTRLVFAAAANASLSVSTIVELRDDHMAARGLSRNGDILRFGLCLLVQFRSK